jgi:RimJ/RimL family protein N-acetyltransferase
MISGKRVVLRGLEVEDAKEILKHWNDLEVQQFTGRYVPTSLQDEEAWIRAGWEASRKNIQHVFGIVDKSSLRLVGTTSFNNISTVHRRSGFGIVIWNKSFWNKGLGSETVNLMVSYGFQILNLQSISLSVFEYNTRARHVYAKAGFQEAGRLRDHIFCKGGYHDLIYMDILATECREHTQTGKDA